MRGLVIGILALLSFVGCTGGDGAVSSEPTRSVPDSALDGLLLGTDEINAIMGTHGMTPHALVSQMADHRNLLPNLNCLGVWQVNEAPIYDQSLWKSVRQQMLRTPDTDRWDSLVVQSVVSYRTSDGARDFLMKSADRWSKCTNHRVNIQLNGRPLPAWASGDLVSTATQLAMPYTRGAGDQTRLCQRVLSLAANLILDIQACTPEQPSGVTQAAEIAEKIRSALPR
jgi:hypothetical protein